MATLKSLVDETTDIKNEIVECHSNLLSMLTSKNVEVSEEDKMLDLIGKVDLLDEYCPPLYLYKEGDKCIDITGDWIDKFEYEYYSTNNTALTFNSDHIYIKATGVNSADSWRGIITTNKINLSKYSKLNFEYEILQCSSSGANLNLSIDSNQSFKDGRISGISLNGVTGRAIKSVLISSTDGYIGLFSNTNGSSSYNIVFKVYNIWLEK